ncbi:ABC transporter permease [Planomicrobium sp. CPCC 101110]|uniref:ABC transporter permease n=1 Tax=Planomicrobium sp. CPCC 101110 TaxID=2599619 RepID=UPI0011B3E1AA|nr:ABC transporter permease [Planomicrobium sp. CPCC 101110]TWT25419.1 ABC transporter permease [Planomicrobium sp. CPCC 101110]
MNSLTTKKLKKSLVSTEFFVLVLIVLLAVFIEMQSGLFFTNNNLVDLLRSMIVPSIFALCAYLGFISTGPDVSFPLIAALSSYIATQFVVITGFQGSIAIVFLVAIAVGLVLGSINGFIIAKYNFPSLIVTLGTSTIFSGILLGAFEASRMELPATMADFGRQSLLAVTNAKAGIGSSLPMTFLIFVGLYIIVYFVLNHTMAGRGVFAVGGDETSAERAGFNVKLIRFGVFTVSGAIAAIAGVCYTVESLYYLPTEFAGEEMIVIAAVILGGTRLMGGVGTLKGTILGTLLITIVTNSLILVGIPVYWQKFFIGAIIIIGTAISVIQSHNLFKSKKSKDSKGLQNSEVVINETAQKQ